MRVADLAGKRVAIWGLGREGRAAIGFIRVRHPDLALVGLDDAADAQLPRDLAGTIDVALGKAAIAAVLDRTDVIVKSPGVSLYGPLVQAAMARGIKVTSLINLWFAEPKALRTICVTGTKGKSTTASLIAHMLTGLGARACLVGNIGVPITETPVETIDYAVVEMSSYQAADFAGIADIGVLTSLFPEHIDWHGSVESYFRDKINLLGRSRRCIVNAAATAALGPHFAATDETVIRFNDDSGLHFADDRIYDGGEHIGRVSHRYLARSHNMSNICAALAVMKSLQLDLVDALDSTRDFASLPHRQQELGEVGGVLFVDDSISTTPESALAALEVYRGRAITLILGGFDRGIAYTSLIERLDAGAARVVICLGASGRRVYAQLHAMPGVKSCLAVSMQDAVRQAVTLTPAGGVVLLSPAAPSYGSYKDFVERGQDFAANVRVLRRDDFGEVARRGRWAGDGEAV